MDQLLRFDFFYTYILLQGNKEQQEYNILIPIWVVYIIKTFRNYNYRFILKQNITNKNPYFNIYIEFLKIILNTINDNIIILYYDINILCFIYFFSELFFQS